LPDPLFYEDTSANFWRETRWHNDENPLSIVQLNHQSRWPHKSTILMLPHTDNGGLGNPSRVYSVRLHVEVNRPNCYNE